MILLTETWLKDKKESLYNLDGFTFHSSNRSGTRKGGGSGIYIRDTWSAKKVASLETKQMSAIWLELHQVNSPPVVYGNVYHPPNLAKKYHETTIDHIIATVSCALQRNKSTRFVITGDFNDLNTTPITQILPFQQLVNFPTRENSMLDLLFTDLEEYCEMGCVKEPPILQNDHCAISVASPQRKIPSNYQTITKRHVTPESKIALSRDLECVNWSNVYDAKTVDSKVEKLHCTIQTLVDHHCPVRKVRVPIGRPAISSPLIRKLRRAKQNAFRSGNQKWRYFSKQLKIEIRKELAKITDSKVNNTVNGSKAWWRTIKELTGERHTTNDAPLINIEGEWLSPAQFGANLNEFYLAGHDTIDIDYPEVPPISTPIETISEETVFRLLCDINTKKSTNSSDFPSWVSKNNATVIHKPMHDIINTILQSGTYPSLWKKAEVAPIKKIKNPKEYKDMRPISLLFHLGKIAEKAVNTLLQKEVPSFSNQYAYTRTIGTNDALVKFTTDIVKHLENDSTIAVQALLIDFSKAFDRMRPDILVRRMLELNISPPLIKVVQSFLSDRQQCIKSNGNISDYLPVKIGVPQGTLTGPILWNIFVNSLRPEASHIKYADDTTIYNAITKQSVETISSTRTQATINIPDNRLQQAATHAKEWSDANEMLLNTTKTTAITFTLRKAITSNAIEIDNMPIQEVTTTKLLGVTFDQHLTFTTQVDNAVSRASSSFHALIQLKRAGVNAANLLTFYQTRILSVLFYGAPAWYPHITQHAKDRLQRYERLCLRIIFPNLEGYDSRLKHIGQLDINARLDIACLKYVSRVKGNPDHPLNDSEYIPPPTTATAGNRYHPRSRKFRTSLYKNSLFFRFL